MRGKWMITVMIGLFFLLPDVAWAEKGGMPDCTTDLAVCTTKLADAQTNLATCQASISECNQKAWGQKLDCTTTTNCPRFKVLSDWNNEAVLDRETCLVWESTPSTDYVTSDNASSYCYGKNVGGRRGWRLPTVEELASLVDPAQKNPALPPGHPFTNVQLGGYYFSSTLGPKASWQVGVGAKGEISMDVGCNDGGCGTGPYAWCVRGGQGVDYH